MDLDQAIAILKTIKKSSTALDEFLHVDLSLVAADELDKFQTALKVVYKNIYEGNVSKEDIRSKIFTA